MSELVYWSAARIARAIRAGDISAREVVDACLMRIDQVNPAINAVVQLVPERARAEADLLDRETARGDSRGPLHGVPITLKDSIDTLGIVSTGGTMGRKDFIPAKDAPVAARLRAAGAVLLGKTNTPELTFSGETCNLIYGRTRNPFDLDRSPGGSSGGSAAIIACGGSALELGSDTGGSIREPAHLCGIAGIKPTSGRTPRSGHIVAYGGGALDSLTQIGPMARSVEDLALSLPIICGPDGEDPYVHPVAIGDPSRLDLGGLRIAWHADNGIRSPDPEIQRVVAETADALTQAGLKLQSAVLPETREIVDIITELRFATNAGLIRRLLEHHGTEQHSPELDGYLALPGSEHDALDPRILEDIDRLRSKALGFFSDFDVILCPASFALARPHKASHADSFKDWCYLQPQNLLGWPGAVVRAGISAQGLPVGVQIVAPPWREDIALALAMKVESLMGGFEPPPL